MENYYVPIKLLRWSGEDSTNSSKLLLVEDNVSFRKFLKEGLLERSRSLEVEEAGDWDEALEKTKSFHPQLILMDIRLPRGSGLDLTGLIKKDYPDINIVILSNYDLPEYRRAASQAGASDYLCKGSASFEQIVAVVKNALAL
jgi:DNA-binding NarL/FixJ family response regulator